MDKDRERLHTIVKTAEALVRNGLDGELAVHVPNLCKHSHLTQQEATAQARL